MKRCVFALVLIAAGGGGCENEKEEPVRHFTYKVERIMEDGEITKVDIIFPGTSSKVSISSPEEMDDIIKSTKNILKDLENLRQGMPEGESNSPPPLIEPE